MPLKSCSRETVPCLCMVDEILRGTNSTERLGASTEILHYLSGGNAIVVVSSHDAQLARSVQEIFSHYHFSGTVDARGLQFDYQLTEGICSSRNAIDLLKYLDYPAEIVAQAQTRVAGQV